MQVCKWVKKSERDKKRKGEGEEVEGAKKRGGEDGGLKADKDAKEN